MNMSLRPCEISPMPQVRLLPDTAPFSAEQRDWLNGFFAALLAAPAAGAPLPAPEPEPDITWHDPALTLEQRMALAKDQPLDLQLYAAMAQQDCGQCGYVCATYAAALAGKAEARLNLCAPGGKDTFRMVKALLGDGAAGVTPQVAPMVAAPAGIGRDNPVPVRFVGRQRLNLPSSQKETWHIEIDLAGSGLCYQPGDSFGVFPRNDLRLVDAIIALIGARPEAVITLDGREMRLRDALTEVTSLGAAPDTLFQLMSYVTGGDTRLKAKRLAEGEDPDGDLDRLDVLGALHKFAGVKLSPEAFVEALERQQPRLYSISSSPLTAQDRLTLTVDKLHYRLGRRERFGVASTFLDELVTPGQTMMAYVQKAHSFALPKDAGLPVIMIGPGTGVAPFRAFVQHRAAVAAPGKNWLFYGHQRRDSDFFYEAEWAALQKAGVLNRLTLAWSRDGDEKIYVQDRMRQVGHDLWSWLEQGAHVYVCGDAKRMARDVERALVDVVAAHGGRSSEAAISYVAGLKKSGRYQADVY
ncbi:MAG: sulfite reductase subunit alpha [Hyphomicrobiales bacterium]|nr:sulfite reductase subunit alpha [Hyphomicrobiales bacterium]